MLSDGFEPASPVTAADAVAGLQGSTDPSDAALAEVIRKLDALEASVARSDSRSAANIQRIAERGFRSRAPNSDGHSSQLDVDVYLQFSDDEFVLFNIPEQRILALGYLVVPPDLGDPSRTVALSPHG